ncbi:hypothetical protein VA596_50020 [Amycolatopsis sp., V23-08]|uniref:ABC transporter permease n=1 Tax=Amycolatopsis heterodermiae TaxID=3110235 RepID=A0ABU5RPK8_9PSEU|nr:hypothetical protein [Amycolatopsis sp., V23-08]MEA5367749.1 hypothetical protein [Amycolatopsis sp., V23-08]
MTVHTRQTSPAGPAARVWAWLLGHDHTLEVAAITVRVTLLVVFILGALLGGAR